MKQKIKKAIKKVAKKAKTMKHKGLVGLGLVFALSLTVTASVGAEVSLQERIIEVAGKLLGERIWEQAANVSMGEDVTDEPVFGAQPGPDSFFPQECHQGICNGYVQASITPTTTVCILRNPLNATSTILSWTANVTANNLGDALGSGGRTTHVFEVSTTTAASGGYGSTSPAIYAAGFRQTVTGDKRVGLLTGEEPRVFSWTPAHATTTAWRQDNQVEYRNEDEIYLAANEYLTMRIATGTPGTFASTALTGTCSAVFLRVR